MALPVGYSRFDSGAVIHRQPTVTLRCSLRSRAARHPIVVVWHSRIQRCGVVSAAPVAVGQDLVLPGFGANDDIPLTLNDTIATGDNVLAFDVAGHELTINVVTDGLFEGQASVVLFQPESLGLCDTNLVPLVQDCFSSTGHGTISLDVADTTCVGGIQLDLASGILDSSVVELSQGPYTTGEDISTELVQLELSADGGATLGEITIRLRSDLLSTGAIENVMADATTGEFISGDSFIDVFIEVEIAGMGLTLDTGTTPFRLEAGTITGLPPLGNDYLPPPGGEPLMLFTVGTTDHIGWFCHAQHTPTEVVPCP